MTLTPEEELIQQVEAAFPDRPYAEPPEVSSCGCPECRDLCKYYTGKRWHEVIQVFADTDSDAFIMGDAAFAHFLPAILIASLQENDPTYNSVLWDFLEETDGEIRRANVNLTSHQVSVVQDWLEWSITTAESYLEPSDRAELKQLAGYRAQLAKLKARSS